MSDSYNREGNTKAGGEITFTQFSLSSNKSIIQKLGPSTLLQGLVCFTKRGVTGEYHITNAVCAVVGQEFGGPC